ncbi:MAG: hypothetical protein V3T86_04830 [Planctomycetota bacterium]
MRRTGAWTLLILALVAMQVPWVECLAECHEVVHADLGPGRCLSADAVHGTRVRPQEFSHAHATHSGSHAHSHAHRGDPVDGHAHDGLGHADPHGLDHGSQHVKRGFEFVSVHPDARPAPVIAMLEEAPVALVARWFAGDVAPVAAVLADRLGLRSTVLLL